MNNHPEPPPRTRAEVLDALTRHLAGMSQLTATNVGLLTFAVYDSLDEYVDEWKKYAKEPAERTLYDDLKALPRDRMMTSAFAARLRELSDRCQRFWDQAES